MKAIAYLAILLLITGVVAAHTNETFTEAINLIKEKVPCDELSQEQLESIGDYYMEQMHPGEAHEAMDEMMGGEGSASLEQMHINMAESFYCNGNGDVGVTTYPNGMMGGMMNYQNTRTPYTAGMMGFSTGQRWTYDWLTTVLLLASIIILVFAANLAIQERKRSKKR